MLLGGTSSGRGQVRAERILTQLGTGLARTGNNTGLKERKPPDNWEDDRVPTCTSRILEGRSGGKRETTNL